MWSQGVVLAILFVPSVLADGVLHLKLEEFDNPGGQGSNGHCCDGKYGICKGACDHMFAVCLDGVGGTTGMQECEYGQRITDKISDQNHNVFGADIGGIANPMAFRVSGQLPGEILLKVTIKDKDTGNFWAGSNDHVDFLQTIATVSRPTSAEIQTASTRTTECNDHWYGNLCGVHCPPPSGSNDHYTCDPVTGRKQCHQGWEGDGCTVRITTTTTTTTTTTPQPTTTTTTTTTPAPTTTTTTTTTAPTTTTPAPTSPAPTPVQWIERDNADCDTLAQNGYRYQDGVYSIRPGSGPAFRVYCDMSAEGWTVIQRRWDDSVDFDRMWVEYQEGFGSPEFSKNYWIGLENLYRLTNQRNYKLSITMRIGNGEFRYATYNTFRIDSAQNNYALHVAGYDEYSTAGDALKYTGESNTRWHDSMPFSTRDRDNDRWQEGSCAQRYRAGWWFNNCHWALLNGPYKSVSSGWPPCNDGVCIAWRTIKDYEDYSLTRVEMKVLPDPRSGYY